MARGAWTRQKRERIKTLAYMCTYNVVESNLDLGLVLGLGGPLETFDLADLEVGLGLASAVLGSVGVALEGG
jgi:hypothetical protein